ncbi:MAG: hypothetical protein V3R37_05130, partial [Rhodospirillales bacterium]
AVPPVIAEIKAPDLLPGFVDYPKFQGSRNPLTGYPVPSLPKLISPVLSPAAIPQATPDAIPQPMATPDAIPQAKPLATPQPMASPDAIPQATPQATPQPMATPSKIVAKGKDKKVSSLVPSTTPAGVKNQAPIMPGQPVKKVGEADKDKDELAKTNAAQSERLAAARVGIPEDVQPQVSPLDFQVIGIAVPYYR